MSTEPFDSGTASFALPTADAPPWVGIEKRLRRHLAQNLTAALDVAGSSTDDKPAKLKHAELYRRTGLSPSTITKLTQGTTKSGAESNLKLETICRLAWALNIPPFMLLMTQSDWAILASAYATIKQIADDNAYCDALNEAVGLNKVTAGLELARRLGVYPRAPKAGYDDDSTIERQAEMCAETDRHNEQMRTSILAATAISQYSAREHNRAVLTAIGSAVGAHYSNP